jgi:hypothetical protein
MRHRLDDTDIREGPPASRSTERAAIAVNVGFLSGPVVKQLWSPRVDRALRTVERGAAVAVTDNDRRFWI